ncbi:GSCOCG00008535001-RA-CDS, partial [Cotesia congregata]
EEIQGEDIVEIIEEIEVVEPEEEEEEEEVVEEEQPQAVSVTESIHDDSSQSQDKVNQTTDSRSADDNQNNYSQQIVTYDADEDWTLEESDPADEDHHEIVKNTENDLVYTVLSGKKSDKSKQEDPRYIKMERLDENIAEDGTIYYEDGEMGTLYMTAAVNDGEQYQYEEQALEQDDQEQGEQQEQWDGTNDDEDGQLYFKDENGIMQPVYLTEDGNYAIADTSEDPQDNQELKLQQKSDESILGVQELDTNSLRQGSSTSSPTNNDVDNEDNTVTISLIISEDENGLKRTQVIIPTPDALKFPDQNSLAKHRKTHTGDRPFQCLECQDTFPTAPALRRHMSSHNPESKPLPCIYCGRRFLDKPALEKHEKSHLAAEQQRGHVCDICNKTFMTPTDLMVHKKNHDPDKKFDCEVCGREFNRLNNLQRHMMVHQQQGQSQEILSCDVCGITYKFMSSLTRHMVTSHMNPEKLRQQAEEQRRKRENNYKRYLENRKMYETQHGTGYGKRSYRSAMSSDPDDDFA